MNEKSTLIFFTGKMGAGKTTYAKELAKHPQTIYISEDEWLSSIYPEEIKNFDDYIHYSSRIKPLIQSHVIDLLESGLTVVMDFPGNTKRQRQWFKNICEIGNFPHQLIYIKAKDKLCLEQLKKRRVTTPNRNQFDTEEVFYRVTKYFEEPSIEENFNILLIEK